MAAANESISLKRKHLIASALSHHFSVSMNPEPILAINDVSGLRAHILKLAGKWSPQKDNNNEVMKWVGFAENFPADSKTTFDKLIPLNDELALKSVILGNGFTPSEADVILFALLHSCVIGLSQIDREKLPHVLRWMDYIQNVEGFGKLFERILLEKDGFEPQWPSSKGVVKLDVDSNAKKTAENSKTADPKTAEKSNAGQNVKKGDSKKNATGDKEPALGKKKLPEPEPVEKDKELSVSLLKIQVGIIRKASKHPSADSLLVEEIDVGEPKPRQVVSGLAKYCSPDELLNRRVVLITNVKPGKLRDVMSEGLVLCASSEDHTVVEPLIPPEGAKIGEQISFSGVDGKPEDVLNPKKKQLEKITPYLLTDDNGVATFKGIPFMTSGGPCVSSIPKASIK
ncbi:hypothetical protein K2173_023485 [Erythroxylum novogranatense]|uniref:tRNA-binding domain-containing protein n=1 Tax=Erythroxylum novogranatense TaxID=1862640 RepID=A0AAV8TW22_9ROSI|nr:hypothetical protein K2173_023485 [Erythroxylum novogranatense]